MADRDWVRTLLNDIDEFGAGRATVEDSIAEALAAARREGAEDMLRRLAEVDGLPSKDFIREFMAHRHFYAARLIDIVARKDAREYRLEGDWLKRFIPELARALPAGEQEPIRNISDGFSSLRNSNFPGDPAGEQE